MRSSAPPSKEGVWRGAPSSTVSGWDCSLPRPLGLRRETSRVAEYLVLRPRGDAEPRSGHVRAADGLDLLHTTELRL